MRPLRRWRLLAGGRAGVVAQDGRRHGTQGAVVLEARVLLADVAIGGIDVDLLRALLGDESLRMVVVRPLNVAEQLSSHATVRAQVQLWFIEVAASAGQNGVDLATIVGQGDLHGPQRPIMWRATSWRPDSSTTWRG